MTAFVMPVRLILVAALIGFVLARSTDGTAEQVPSSDGHHTQMRSATQEKHDSMHGDGRDAASKVSQRSAETVVTHDPHATHHKKREAHTYKDILNAPQPGCCG